MTGGTVGRGRVADGGADQRTGAGIMTARTRIMGFWGCAYKCIIMTVSTAGRTYRDAGMAGIRCMRRLPGTRMTGRTVGRGRVADGRTDKRAGCRNHDSWYTRRAFLGLRLPSVSSWQSAQPVAPTVMPVWPGSVVCVALPGARMTGRTVGRGRVADGGAD